MIFVIIGIVPGSSNAVLCGIWYGFFARKCTREPKTGITLEGPGTLHGLHMVPRSGRAALVFLLAGGIGNVADRVSVGGAASIGNSS